MRKTISLLKARTSSLVFKFVFYFGIMSLLVIMILGGLLISYLQTQTYKEKQWMMRTSLSHMDAVFTQCCEDTKNDCVQWYKDFLKFRTLPAEDVRASDQAAFTADIKEALLSRSYVHSVYVLNRQDEVVMYISNSSNYSENLEEKLPLRMATEDSQNHPFLWSVKSAYDGRDDVPLLSVYMREAPNDSIHYAGAVVVNIDLEVLHNILFSSDTESDLTEIYIINEKGTVVDHSNFAYCGEDFSYMESIRNILGGEDAVLKEKVGDTLYEFLAQKSEVGGFCIVAQSRYINSIEGIKSTLLTLAAVIIVILTTSVAVAYLVSKKVFHPLREIVEYMQNKSDVEELKKCNGDELRYLKNYHTNITKRIEKLLQAEERDYIIKNLLLDNEIQPLLLENKIVFEGTGYCLALLYCLESEDNEFRTLWEYNVRNSTISEIISGTLSEFGQCTWFEVGFRRILFVIAETPERKRAGENFQKRIEETLHLALRGLDEKNILLIACCAESSKEECTRLYKRLDSILRTRKLLNPRSAVIVEQNYERRNGLEKQTEYLKKQFMTGDKESYLLQLEHFLQCMEHTAWEGFVECMENLVLDFMTIQEKVSEQGGVMEARRQQVRERLESIGSKAELVSWFTVLYEETNCGIQEISACSMNSVMEKAIDYIEKHYGDNDLNMNTLADRLNVSASYFGKLFKEFTGSSMSEYLTKVRMEKAHILLRMDPEKEIAQIAAEVGFSNGAYFATVFKKQFGVSPSKMRDYRVLQDKNAEEE